MSVVPPPNKDNLVGGDGKPSLSWKLFFDAIWKGDRGTAWTPTFTSLTEVGTPSITGRYFQLGQLCYFEVVIIPSTSTTCTAGVTYIDNFPLIMGSDGFCVVVSGQIGSPEIGMCEQSSNRIYPPAWTAVTIPLTIIGIVRAS